MSEILTLADAINVGTVIAAAQQSAKVAWANEHGDVSYGHARHIVAGPENFGFLQCDRDIRDGYLRITTRSGFEHTISVRELIGMVGRGEFSIYDW